ncbi:GTPase Der [Thermodesulfomicrobium sp. WS]|uniref:ribosome biogenesis GTPase Der n=1 Tax=Thermodesulfomicrobium sp. WS TaxID=3004129 RepID=UPI00248FC054|nr:ribosome biogenesis GTPase Der [Thermodesulfomicrobium sp. WS]BDV01324.1 GTPase Der [Thermodesulfomicrobium sp. WS]
MKHLPLVALVGRPNVGKSTLFNRLVGERVSITHDEPGVTRDSIWREVRWEESTSILVDTGGILMDSDDPLAQDVFAQAREAMAEAHVVILVTDGREGLHPHDEAVAGFLRQSGKPVLVVANKVDSPEREAVLCSEFHALGFPVVGVSAAHGHGVPALREAVEAMLPATAPVEEEHEPGLRLAVVGRPNVGKSSLVNALVGQKRLIVSPLAGTTRDAVDVELVRDGRRYVFVDTAGIRRKSRVQESLEYFSVLRSMQAAKSADVTLMVVDAAFGVVAQDKRLAAFLEQEKIPFILVGNKIDLLARGEGERMRRTVQETFAFLSHAPLLFASTVTKAGLGGLLPLAEQVHAQSQVRVPTGELNRFVRFATERQQPPVVGGRRGKIYYMTQAKTVPPTFVFFVNDPAVFRQSYMRFLENQLRKAFGLDKTPVRLVLRSSHDPQDSKTSRRR